MVYWHVVGESFSTSRDKLSKLFLRRSPRIAVKSNLNNRRSVLFTFSVVAKSRPERRSITSAADDSRSFSALSEYTAMTSVVQHTWRQWWCTNGVWRGKKKMSRAGRNNVLGYNISFFVSEKQFNVGFWICQYLFIEAFYNFSKNFN